MRDIERLRHLRDKLTLATDNLAIATSEEIPIGSIVEATLGRSRVRGEVIRHYGYGGNYAGCIYIKNLKTGKVRRVYPPSAMENVVIISTP